MKNLATFISFAAIGLLLGFLLRPWGILDCGGQKPDKIERDTTWVHDTIPYPVPKILIKYLPAPVDSHMRADSTRWYAATGGKITERGDTVGVIYNSPVRLSPAGFFSDFIVKHAPVWIPVDTIFIATTITKYEQYFSWWSTIALLVVGFVAGALAL